MDILEVMKNRHSVRQYTNQTIEDEKREIINSLIDNVNQKSGLNIQVFYDEPQCFSGFMAHYGHFKNVNNYIAIVGNKNQQQLAGYYGQEIVLNCQNLGLNSCWVALTHGKTKAVINKGQQLLIVISLGYGINQGVAHKSKSVEQLSSFDVNTDWFNKGMEAVMLAPTALNQQKFFFELKDSKVTVKDLDGPYSQIDLGIVKYHFKAVTNYNFEL